MSPKKNVGVFEKDRELTDEQMARWDALEKEIKVFVTSIEVWTKKAHTSKEGLRRAMEMLQIMAPLMALEGKVSQSMEPEQVIDMFETALSEAKTQFEAKR